MESFFNRIVKFFLRSPLHGLLSKSIMLITFQGRKSGRMYTTPVSYWRQGGRVLAFTRGAWWRNLPGPVTLRIKGQDLPGQAEPTAGDKTAVAGGLAGFLRAVPGDARYYNVKINPDGQPDPEQVARAAQRVVMIEIRLTN